MKIGVTARIAFGILLAICSAAGVTAGAEVFSLQVLEERFESEKAGLGDPLVELGEKYRTALLELQAKYQKAAELDKLLLVRNEVERFARDKAPAAAKSGLKPLANLQGIYAQQRDLALRERERQLAAIKRAHRARLEAEMKRLTVDGKVDEAVAVREAIAKLGNVSADSPSWERGKVMHLRFESAPGGLVADASGGGNHGRLKGDASLGRGGGPRGGFLSLDGSGDFVECAHSESLSLSTDGTIALWVRPRALHDLRGLVAKYTPKNAYSFRTAKGKRGTRVIFGDFGNANSSRSALRVGEWVHLAVTLADHKVSFYFNGVPDASEFRPKRVPLAQNNNPVRVGSDYDGRYFTGEIDEVRVYRRALTAAEVAALYRAER